MCFLLSWTNCLMALRPEPRFSAMAFMDIRPQPKIGILVNSRFTTQTSGWKNFCNTIVSQVELCLLIKIKP